MSLNLFANSQFHGDRIGQHPRPAARCQTHPRRTSFLKIPANPEFYNYSVHRWAPLEALPDSRYSRPVGCSRTSPVKREMKLRSFSKLELQVEGTARRRADRQLLCVPWGRFRRAYEEYPRWQALALWSEVVIQAGSRGESLLSVTIQKHCPAFGPTRSLLHKSQPAGIHLLEWVHTKRFGRAKQQGWLDALIFYGVRHPLSRGAWRYWEVCQTEFSGTRSAPIIGFERWWRAAQQAKFDRHRPCAAIRLAVERYVESEAFRLWLRPLVCSALPLPARVLGEIRRHPTLSLVCGSAHHGSGLTTKEAWRRSLQTGANIHLRSTTQGDGTPNEFLEQVRLHPWYVRIHAFAAHEESQGKRSQPSRCRSFRQWQRDASNYMEPR